jgi:hypothetical protein
MSSPLTVTATVKDASGNTATATASATISTPQPMLRIAQVNAWQVRASKKWDGAKWV